jgi:UDP-N-acetylglucosamine 2-epimerase (non-hydrolysing)/GDP/UDP-N,N'-diacetylbacillosamine 2-epimerase (hydrolysing)
MRTIAVVTVARSDYGLSLPILRLIQRDPSLRLHLIAAAAHLAPEFGLTVRAIEADGLPIAERVEMLLASDTPEAIATSMGLGVTGFAKAYARVRPDLVVVLGDRFEMHAAALAALPFAIPVAHIHGGELTQGAIDDALRHSLTKLSHLHFVATEEFARRVRQLGEEAWRVTVSGAPGLDGLRDGLLGREALESRFGLRLDRPPVLATFHPATLEADQAQAQAREWLAALEASEAPILFTMPNADTNGRAVRALIGDFVVSHPEAQVVETLGTPGYASVMALAAAMVGNSSSGLVEAGSFGLPVVNVGARQEGRLRGPHVIDVGNGRDAILAGIRRALSSAFRAGLRGMANPYGDGHAAERIVARLAQVPLDGRLIRKRFADAPDAAMAAPETADVG